MALQDNRVRPLPLLIAAIFLCVTGIAVVMSWALSSSDDQEDLVAAAGQSPSASRQGTVRARLRCAECGVVVSTREIAQIQPMDEVKRDGRTETVPISVKRYEITVRMRDGSNRVFMDARRANWRPGARITLIGGASPLRR